MAFPVLELSTPFGLAHRGGAVGAPENTLAAFVSATELGYRFLETDVHRTSDGVLVAFHDDDLSRVAGIEGRIADRTWAEVSQIELEGDHRIPRLIDLLSAFPDARFNIDPKADDAVEPLVAVISEFEAVDRVNIGAFSEVRITRMRRDLGPSLCTSPGPAGLVRVLLAAYLFPKWRPPYGCVQIPTRQYGLNLSGKGLIRRLKRLGLQVHYWTINTEAEMVRLVDNGADAIITDEIELLKTVLTRRGEWSES